MIIHSEQEMLDYGEQFAKKLTTPTVIELIGDVGAGKTTFVRGLAKGLGVKDPITSPSFTISKQYALPNNKRLVHYDFYRLPDPGLMSEDLQENLTNKNTITIIEWSDSVTNLLPKNRIIINIEYNEDGSRNLKPIFYEH
jgi:tRNA threonylcarbamoyladenosine biosynthesis protein TsaE